ncbi:LysM peptidoglycan-binding domain-containing protein [candidate division WOR-3 bacterium]|nr:LysM peptidoglycan-binding domain-containing protein [candidate division WOR-3 bacterium]
MQKWRFFLLIAILPACIWSESFSIHTQPRYHIVSPGDCLWNLSHYYLGNPYKWPMIWEANKPQIRDPHWIYPGQKFLIPAITDIVSSPELFDVPPGVQVSLVDIAKPVVAYELAYRCGYISRERLTGRMHIVDYYDREVPQLTSGFQCYIDAGSNKGISEGQMLIILRESYSVNDPMTGRDLGKIVHPLGVLKVLEVKDAVSRCLIQETYDNSVVLGDVISEFVMSELPTNADMQLAQTDLTGYIIRITNYVGTIKNTSFVYLNIGSNTGVEVGDVFEILIPAETVTNPATGARVTIPERPSGYVQILNVQNETSSGYIFGINGISEIKAGDKIKLLCRANL